MFGTLVLITIILLCIVILTRLQQFKIKTMEHYTVNDIELSLFENIPKTIIENNRIAVTRDRSILCMYIIDNIELEKPIIGYFKDEDLNYIKRMKQLYKLKGSNRKIQSEDDIQKCTHVFLKTRYDDAIFKKMSSKYSLLNFDKTLEDYTHYFLPLSKVKKTVDAKSNSIIDIIEIPNVVINNKKTLIDEVQTIVLNAHYGKKISDDRMNFLMQASNNTIHETTIIPEHDYECVDTVTGDKLTEYKLREACESDYDAFGNMKPTKHKWNKLCKSNGACKYYMKSKNKSRGKCINGYCELPLNLNDTILHYGDDTNDHVYPNDTYERLKQKITPILNI